MSNGQWSLFPQSAVASGWSYYAWPYAYSVTSGGWFYLYPGSATHWSCDMNSGYWSVFGLTMNPPTLLTDAFSGSSANSSLWRIPTWISPTDGTFVGRTQFRCTQNASLPSVTNGRVVIALNTFNPLGSSFYGTDLISIASFDRSAGLSVTVRAKLDAPIPGGLVGGIFLYAPPSTPGDTRHDEIDFELLSNDPTRLLTNIYGDETLGAGHPAAFVCPNGPTTDYHTYQILWLPGRVSWYVDGVLLRSVTTESPLPTGPLYLHLNLWAPGAEFTSAYNAALNWTTNSSADQMHSMSIDWVIVSR
jgi:hypothetical protein